MREFEDTTTSPKISESGLLRQHLRLVVRDDVEPLLRHILSEDGYGISAAQTVEEAMRVEESEPSDLVIIDAALCPLRNDVLDADAITRSPTPMLLLTEGSHDARILPDQGELGIVNVLFKPVDPDQLIGRVRALLRKVRATSAEPNELLSFEGVEIDLRRHRVYRNSRRIDAGPLDFRLLCHLARHPRQVFSRRELIDAVWPRDARVDARTVDAHVVALRKALNKNGEPNVIQTVRSAGYSLDLDE